MTNSYSQPERTEAKLKALSDSVLTLTANLNLDSVLSEIAGIAATLIGAKYAALGLPDGKGGLAKFITHGVDDATISAMDHYPLGRGLLGVLVNRPEPIRLEDMTQDERSAGMPPQHPHMQSFLGVPILTRGKSIGSLYFCDKHDGLPFTEDDEQMVILLAAHASIAIENAQLYRELKKLAIVEERDRISMELHDGIIQQIYAVGIKLDLLRLKLPDQPAASATILEANHNLNKVIEDLRKYIQDLRVSVNYNAALHEQVHELTEAFKQVSSARLIVDMAQGFAQFDEIRLHAVIQIMRETLSNIARHANATEVYVDLHERPNQINLVISDDGTGFDPKSVKLGSGLQNLQQRVRQLNGQCDIISQPGRGSTISVSLPV